jgi:hypothetical protein
LIGTSTAVIGAGVWHTMLVHRTSLLTFPVVVGVGSLMLYSTGSLLIQPSGTRWELLWGVVVLAVLLIISFRLVLRRALIFDRRSLESDRGRMVCPNCGQLTPIGTFCAACGQPLAAADPSAAAPPAETESAPDLEREPAPATDGQSADVEAANDETRPLTG